jgi:hypothetical protein
MTGKPKTSKGGKMRKIALLSILISVIAVTIGCTEYDKNPYNEVKEFYETPHQLRKMFTKEEEVTIKTPANGSLSGGFFLFIGAVSGEYKEGTETKYAATYVRFAWEIKDNTYVITTLPLEKIRIKLTEQTEAPTVSFVLDQFAINEEFNDLIRQVRFSTGENRVNRTLRRILANYYEPNEAFSKYLAYAVFTARSEDWPTNINLPANKGYSE